MNVKDSHFTCSVYINVEKQERMAFINLIGLFYASQ
nr:MAG TPA: hypothetical protein [Caudoviricetes sp.]